MKQDVMSLNGSRGRMTDAEYERRRDGIRKTADPQAGGRLEQELARLFVLSGWTSEELVKKENNSRLYISRLLKFGQFLQFSENSPKGSILETSRFHLNERRFRSYWQRADMNDRSDNIRFREVARMIEADGLDLTLRRQPYHIPWAEALSRISQMENGTRPKSLRRRSGPRRTMSTAWQIPCASA
jgi:hypothetical protein